MVLPDTCLWLATAWIIFADRVVRAVDWEDTDLFSSRYVVSSVSRYTCTERTHSMRALANCGLVPPVGIPLDSHISTNSARKRRVKDVTVASFRSISAGKLDQRM